MKMNFSAGASYIEPSILDHLDTSIMQSSHRDAGGAVQNMLVETQARVRRLLEVPENYHILLMHGGAHAQFAAIPLNLNLSSISYVNTGQWSEKFAAEASKICEVVEIARSRTRFPCDEEWGATPGKFVHVCANETVTGIEMHHDPAVKPIVVADFTSTLMSRPVDIARYGVVYASSGKNLGTPGFCVVIVRRDLLARVPGDIPSILSWKVAADSMPIQNLYNTPPILPIQISHDILGMYLENGGVAHYRTRAERVSAKIYKCIDESEGFYTNTVSECSRSRMNIVFDAGAHTGEFIQLAISKGMHQLKNHPMADSGMVRATVYNMLPEEFVDELARFMEEFRRGAYKKIELYT